MAKRANGTGTVRKVTRMIGGKKYEYWEARYTDGVDLGTGKQRRRSITGKTQKEVMQKLTAATAAIDSGTYIQPSKQTLGQWLDVWEKTYLSGVKPRTRAIYADNIRLHIKPALGAVRLEALNTHEIQRSITPWESRAGRARRALLLRLSRTFTVCSTRRCGRP